MDQAAKQLSVSDFRQAYMNAPDFVGRMYEVPAVAELVGRTGVVGVARYIVFPSFAPERLFTLVYRPGAVEVSAVTGALSLWSSGQGVNTAAIVDEDDEAEEPEPFDPGRACRRSAVLGPPFDECPPLLRTWESVRAAAAQAGDCSTLIDDGVVYRHQAADQGFRAAAAWYNPDPSHHAPQLALIEAYTALIGRLWA